MHFKFIEAHFPKSHPWASLIGACAPRLSRPGPSASIPDICRPTFKKAGGSCQHQLLSSCLERTVASWPNFLSPVSSNAARCQSLGTASRCSARTSRVSSNPAGIRDHPAKRHWLGQEGKKAAQLRDGGGRGQRGQQQGPRLVPERGQCLASGPAQSTSVQKCEPAADSATELVHAASPGLRCQFWGGCDRINPKPAFSAAVE